MHHAALKAVGLSGEYREYPVPPDRLDSWLEHEATQLEGFNVTMPYKKAVWRWLAHTGSLGKSVRPEIQAVNTVRKEGGRWWGENTDGMGFLMPLVGPTRSLSLAGWRVVLLGAGGAAEAVAASLLGETRIQRLIIWNRHIEKANDLAMRLNAIYPNRVDVVQDPSELPVDEAHLVVNATSLGMEGYEEVPWTVCSRLHHGQMVYDLVYQPRQTGLIRAALERGCKVVTGDEMLAAQAALAFSYWTGVAAETVWPVMRQALDQAFSSRIWIRGKQ
jgi:shikimate dehydrogenase